MLITKTSPLSGKTHEREIACTPGQMILFEMGMHVQKAFPHLSADDREFIFSGITPEEWEEYLGADEDI